MQLRTLDSELQQVSIQFLVIFDVTFLLAFFNLVQRRLSDIHMAAIDKFSHLAVKEGQQQGTNMRSVDIGIGHDNDLVVTQFFDIEFLSTDTATQRGNQCSDFGRLQHFIESCFFDVQNLSLERQDSLRLAITALLCRAASRIALDKVDLRQ